MSEFKVLNGDSTAKYLQAINTGATGDPYIPVQYPFGLAVAGGHVAKHTAVNKFGRNGDVDTGAPEDVWSLGGLHVPPTTARTHDIVSTNVNDTSAGTGARTVKIYGLDSAFALQEETITMNGTTNVPTVSTYTRIFRMVVLTAGSGVINAGVITATAQTDATVTAQIDTGRGQTLMAIYTVPADYVFYINRVFASMSRATGTANTIAEGAILIRSGIDTANPVLTTSFVAELSIEGASILNAATDQNPLKVVGPADVIMRVLSVSDNNTIITGAFDGILIDES
jgi:hypothetical protein